MFLEIAGAPKVPYPEEPTNTENEYSVFGPSQATAAVQVISLSLSLMMINLLNGIHVCNCRAH